jgi:hypothetical protein
VPIGIASRNCDSVGASPKNSRLRSRISGLSTSTAPTATIVSWLRKSTTARTTLTPTASLTPRVLMSARSAMRPIPKKTSPGAVSNHLNVTPPA